MSENSDLYGAVRAMAGINDLDFESKVCIVSEIDLVANTCTCSPIDGTAKFFDVVLSQTLSKGFLLIPTNGSRAVCTQISDTTAYISMVSDVSQVYIAGDVNGGLIKVIDLVTKLNNIENLLNGFIALYNAHIHVGVDSVTSAPITISPTVAQQTTTLTPTVRANIENTIVKHGNG